MLGVMIVASQNGFLKNEYRKFNMKNNELLLILKMTMEC